jgi:hypothetical protein
MYHSPNHILPCRRRRLHAIITPNGQRKNNGENSSRLCDFTVLTLTIFSIKLLLPGPSCDGRYINSQTDFCPAAPADRSCLLQSSRDTKRTVRNNWVLIIFHFFRSPFFNKIAIIMANARSVKSQPQQPVLPRRHHCPLEFVTTERRCKKNGENPFCFEDFTVFSHTFFSIKLLFSGLSRDL